MRQTHNPQLKFGETTISEINIDITTRDDIPPLLLGLQYIYTNTKIREQVFSVLEETISPDKSHDNGRPGMNLWKILVLGVLRLNLNWDYDRLQEMANNHKTIRQMLGHGFIDNDHTYKLQTLKDNVYLLTPETLNKINEIVVKAGHKLVKKKDDEALEGRCDSFVVETNVHYPTDINLLYDAIRKVVTLVAAICIMLNFSDWRQSKHNLKTIKRLFRKAQQLKRSTSKNPEKMELRKIQIIEAHQEYIDKVQEFLSKARTIIEKIDLNSLPFDINLLQISVKIMEIQGYMQHAERQIYQISRRVIEGEKIPHAEKVFSVFQGHTEWINKGKAGVPVELGLKVCVLEDKYGFILQHKVMQKQTDDQVAIPMVEQTLEIFPELNSCSFDKGFHSPTNQQKLRSILNTVVLPKKGRLSKVDKEREYSKDFINKRHQHSAIESAINALEVHGLDMCPDHGIDGFERYVSMAVLARNIQQLGVKLRQIEMKKLRKKKFQQAA